jgi:hypothetical protein
MVYCTDLETLNFLLVVTTRQTDRLVCAEGHQMMSQHIVTTVLPLHASGVDAQLDTA